MHKIKETFHKQCLSYKIYTVQQRKPSRKPKNCKIYLDYYDEDGGYIGTGRDSESDEQYPTHINERQNSDPYP